MAISKQQKDEIVQELIKKFSEAKSVAFGQYAGMSVLDMSKMRRAMRKEGVEFKVAKRTLFKIAAKESGVELPDEIMEGTVGAAFSYDDVVAGPKLLKQASKENDVVKLLGGVMEGRVLSVNEMAELANLPGKEELLAKFVGVMRSPLYGFHGMLSSGLGGFARALQAYAEKMPEEAKADEAPAAEEPPAVEEAAPAEEAPVEPAAADEAPAEESAE